MTPEARRAGDPGGGITGERPRRPQAYVRLPPGTDLAPGDLVCLGVSHPWTTFDKWRVIPVITDGYHVIDAVHTFF
jgi:D-serine deaminase-like pyridoxal phosphate-dependent protein